MNELPLVSVVIPSYNHREYVKEAIDSVLDQTYTNCELIVIDDGSNDGSVDFLENYSSDRGFSFVSQSNRGVCRTLNRAINEFANGTLICILASDDYFHPDKIALQVEALNQNSGSEFCYTQAIEFDSEKKSELNIFPKKVYSGNVLNKIFLRQPYAAGSIMFSKSLFLKLKGFDESLRVEDWDFSIRCAAATTFTAVSKPVFYYRSHSTNSMKTMNRMEIFRDKAVILSKNYLLVPSYIWLFSIMSNFIYDSFYSYIKHLNIKKVIN